MPRKKTKTSEPVYTDIIVNPLLEKDENGNELFEKIYKNGKKTVKKEIVTEKNL